MLFSLQNPLHTTHPVNRFISVILKRQFNKLISITNDELYWGHCKPFTRLVKIKIPNNPPIANKLEPKSFNRSIDLFWFFQRWIHLPFFFSISILFHSYSAIFWQWLIIDGRNILDNNPFFFAGTMSSSVSIDLCLFSQCV